MPSKKFAMSKKSSFQNLINSDIPVFIDFHAEWCGPCKAMNPVIKQLSKQMGKDLRIVKIDIDKNQALAGRLNIRGVPTFALYQNGKQLWRQAGMQTLDQLVHVIESNTIKV